MYNLRYNYVPDDSFEESLAYHSFPAITQTLKCCAVDRVTVLDK